MSTDKLRTAPIAVDNTLYNLNTKPTIAPRQI